MTQEAAAVGEALELFAALDIALVRSVMLVHVFALKVSMLYFNKDLNNSPPFAFAVE